MSNKKMDFSVRIFPIFEENTATIDLSQDNQIGRNESGGG
jgi:hypothetical protein